MRIKINKYRDITPMPNRVHYNDSGADVFALKDILLTPYAVTVVPLGFSIDLPDGCDAVVHCKSGLSSKGIFAMNAPIDAGYTGEVHAILYNSTDKDYLIFSGEKVGQLVIRPVIYADFVEDLGEERNEGKFGSTGK